MILLTSEVDKIFIGQILNERTKVALVLHTTCIKRGLPINLRLLDLSIQSVSKHYCTYYLSNSGYDP